jgi:flagellar protein FlaG
MDGIANVARMQQSQVASSESQGRASELQKEVQQPQKQDVVKQMQQQNVQGQKLDSKEKVEELVKQLNDAMAPMNTNIKFGVDSQDIFYVSVIEEQTNKMIRRFPAEQAQDFLPKMQEVTGILFDSKG